MPNNIVRFCSQNLANRPSFSNLAGLVYRLLLSLCARCLLVRDAFIKKASVSPRKIVKGIVVGLQTLWNGFKTICNALRLRNLRQLTIRGIVRSFIVGFLILINILRLRKIRRVYLFRVLLVMCCCILGCLLFQDEVAARWIELKSRHQEQKRISFSPTTEIPKIHRVVIVEEHHEVLKYWYKASADGLIPKEGLTLLHFDGHSDAAPLSRTTGKRFPWFRWPWRYDEIQYLMQENDNFIMAAAFTKLLKRYIWVWPKWDAKSHGTSIGYDAYRIYLGWGKRSSGTGKKAHKEICGCVFNDKIHECRMKNSSDIEHALEGIEINEHDCHFEHRGIVEIVREDVALEKLETDVDWINPKEPLILDIDADFYGCESPALALVNTGFTWRMVEDISRKISRLICARNTQQESGADRLLVRIVNMVQRNQLCAVSKCEDQMPLDKVKHVVASFVEDLESDPDYYGMFCFHDDMKLLRTLDDIVTILARLNSKQLNALRWVGFCLRTTPKSYSFSPYDAFQVCSGVNFPSNNSAATFYSPNKEDILNRTRDLQSILYDKVITPGFVSISRSIRDGYTPRKQVAFIEENIIATVFQVVNVHHTVIDYDSDLLWGKRGWLVRESRSGPLKSGWYWNATDDISEAFN